MLPAYIANMAPVFVRKIPVLGWPIDFRKKVGGTRILGDHKTARGILAGIIAGIIIFSLQVVLFRFEFIQAISLVHYENFFAQFSVIPGFLLGFGAMFGDAIKSFFKRRVGIKPGSPWIPFDQIDFIIGAVIFILPLYHLSWKAMIILLIATPILHIATNHIGYYLKIRKVKW